MTAASLIVALSHQRYRVERPFFLPSSGTVTDVSVTEDGLIHVLIRRDPLVDSPGPAIIRLKTDGTVLAEYGTEVADAHMFASASNEAIYVVDRDAHEVIKFCGDKRVGGLGTRYGPREPFNHPTGVAVAPNGSLYVCEGYAGHTVWHFDSDGQILSQWGSHGRGPREFVNAHALWVRPDGSVVIVDRENDRLQIFDPNGVLLHIWTGFVKPLDVWGDSKGRLYVIDLAPSLTLLDVDGTRLGQCRPVLNVAHGLCGAPDGTIYFAEPSPNRISRIVPLD